MKKLFALLMTLTVILGIATLTVSAAEDDPWIVFIEAENLNCDKGKSVSVVEKEGTIGGKALTCTVKANDANGDGFTLYFTVPEDGTYTVWGRLCAPTQLSNSFHYSVDGGTAQVWDMIDEAGENLDCYGNFYYMYLTFRENVTYDADSPNGGTFTQSNGVWRHSPNYLTLTKGEHSIHFTGREAGWFVDQFVITELDIETYNPNACEGNEHLFVGCSFCNASWKHYFKDVYAVKGVTAEEYFYSTLYPNAQRDTNPDQPVITDPPPATEPVVTTPEVTEPVVTTPAATTPAPTEPATSPDVTEPEVTTEAPDDDKGGNSTILWIVIAAAVVVVVVVVVVVIKKKK